VGDGRDGECQLPVPGPCDTVEAESDDDGRGGGRIGSHDACTISALPPHRMGVTTRLPPSQVRGIEAWLRQ